VNTDNILIRGIPGSGKSTYARTHFPDHVLIEADQFFMVDGVYIFDPKLLPKAHEWCFNQCRKMYSSFIPFVVANTFSRHWEMKPYLDAFPGIRVLRCLGTYENIHGVPPQAVERTRQRFEGFKGEELVK
jgi:hypothetical protein